MLSEEGIPLVPTSGGVDEAVLVHGLDSPFLSAPYNLHAGSRGAGWGAAPSTPRFSHSSSFSGFSSARGSVDRGLSSSYGGGYYRRREVGAGAGRGEVAGGRARRLSLGEAELRRGMQQQQRAMLPQQQQQQQQRHVKSFELSGVGASGGGAGGRLSDPSSSILRGLGASGSTAGTAAAAGADVGASELPVTPRFSHSSSTAGSNRNEVFNSSMAAAEALQNDSSSGGTNSRQAELSANSNTSPAGQQPTSGLGSLPSPGFSASEPGVTPAGPGVGSQGPVSSPVSHLAAKASAVAAAVAAAAAASAAGSPRDAASQLQGTAGDQGGNGSSGNNSSSAMFASDAALFSRSGWAGLHMPHQQQQQQQQLMGQWSFSRREGGGGDSHGPTSLFATPKDRQPRLEAAAVLPTLPRTAEQP